MNPINRLLAAVAPTAAAARRAAADIRRRRRRRVSPFSLARYLRTANAPSRIVLCPAGHDLTEDIEFLHAASRRLLWPPPGPILAEAIAAMLGLEEPAAARKRPRGEKPAAGGEEAAEVYFVEGAVTPERAKALLDGGVRRWIAVSPRSVRITGRLFARLDQLGVKWFALEPLEAAGVIASPSLARSRPRWKQFVPDARIWIRATR